MKKTLFAIATLLLLAGCSGGQGGKETDAESEDSVGCVRDTVVSAVTQGDTLPVDYGGNPVSDSVQTLIQTEEAERNLGAEKESFTVGGVTFTMTRVEGGTFTMGATAEQEGAAGEDEFPAHRVTLSDYYIGTTEVTQSLWKAVMGESVTSIAQRYGWDTYGVGAKYPMYYVSWYDVQVFLRKLNAKTGKRFRLPTEAEWEYAARGGNRSKGFKYAGSDDLDEVAWYGHNAGGTTHPVATKKPNELGLYDMSGNVWEWCSDYYQQSPGTNPKGPSSGSYRVLRGGGWINDAQDCCSSSRNCTYPSSYSHNDIGFRLAFVL